MKLEIWAMLCMYVRTCANIMYFMYELNVGESIRSLECGVVNTPEFDEVTSISGLLKNKQTNNSFIYIFLKMFQR